MHRPFSKKYVLIVLPFLAVILQVCAPPPIDYEAIYTPYDIHYAGEKVGTARFESIIVPGEEAGVFRDFIIEEFKYFSARYEFQFILERELQFIQVKRFQGDTDRIIVSNSYRLYLEQGQVRRTFYRDDGSLANTVVMQDRATVEYVEDLFRLCGTFINSYYLSKTVEQRRAMRMPSLGYQLLIQERL